MPLNMDRLEAYKPPARGGDATFAGFISGGNTSCMIVIDPRCDPDDELTIGGLSAPAYDYNVKWAEGKVKRTQKYIILAIVASADNADGLTRGWNGDMSDLQGTTAERAKAIGAQRVIVPLAVSSTLHEAMLKSFKANSSPVDVDIETGVITRPSTEGGVSYAVRLIREGKMLNTTYDFQTFVKVSAAEAAVFKGCKVALLPSTSITEIAADYSAWRKERAEKEFGAGAPPSSKPPSAPKSLSSVAADLGDDELMDLI